MVDILEAVRAARLRSVKASVTFSETRDQITHNNANFIKAKLSQEPTENHAPEMEAAQLYYKMVDDYKAATTIRMPNLASNKSIAFWKRVVDAYTECGVTAEVYLKAQFEYFHKNFGKVPKIYQLTTQQAKDRVVTFSGSSKKIVGNGIEYKADLATKLRTAEQQMQQLCRAHKISRAEVYERFILTGLFIFPKEYLDADPIYKELKK